MINQFYGIVTVSKSQHNDKIEMNLDLLRELKTCSSHFNKSRTQILSQAIDWPLADSHLAAQLFRL